MTKQRIPYQPDTITPPGETLAELLEERGITEEDLAQRLGSSVEAIRTIIDGHTSIDVEMAEQLEKIVGVSAEYWLNHEAKYRASLLHKEVR
jgi:HTH-type transcriptional regulator/antitoxin HigA